MHAEYIEVHRSSCLAAVVRKTDLFAFRHILFRAFDAGLAINCEGCESGSALAFTMTTEKVPIFQIRKFISTLIRSLESILWYGQLPGLFSKRKKRIFSPYVQWLSVVAHKLILWRGRTTKVAKVRRETNILVSESYRTLFSPSNRHKQRPLSTKKCVRAKGMNKVKWRSKQNIS